MDKAKEIEKIEKKHNKGGIPIKLYKTVHQCKICMSPHRPMLEEMLMNQIPYVQIEKWAREKGLPISDSALYRHTKKHLKAQEQIDQFCYGRILKKVAERGNDFLNVLEVLSVMIEKGVEDMGEFKISPETLARVIEAKHKISGKEVLDEAFGRALGKMLEKEAERQMREEPPIEGEIVG